MGLESKMVITTALGITIIPFSRIL